MQPDNFRAAVLAWFDQHGRKHLPWQQGRDPYRVWVSEIMLQQTQVATVIPYFERFIARFPDIGALAAGTPDEVAALWAGLGYYARARNLHRAAQQLAEQHGGALPADLDAIAALPGIGRSTAGAILSLGFGLRAPILDGNVKRVLCRYAGLEGWPGAPDVQKELWQLSEALTPAARVADYNQAMMDLGATVCLQRAPACGACPLRDDCEARRQNLTAAIPAPRPKREQPVRQCHMLVLRDGEGQIYLERRPPSGIWGGLWSLPEFDSFGDLERWCAARGVELARLERLAPRRHTFTHFRLDYVPVLGRAASALPGVADDSGRGWFQLGAAPGLPAPVARLLQDIAGKPEGPPGQIALDL